MSSSKRTSELETINEERKKLSRVNYEVIHTNAQLQRRFRAAETDANELRLKCNELGLQLGQSKTHLQRQQSLMAQVTSQTCSVIEDAAFHLVQAAQGLHQHLVEMETLRDEVTAAVQTANINTEQVVKSSVRRSVRRKGKVATLPSIPEESNKENAVVPVNIPSAPAPRKVDQRRSSLVGKH